MAIKNYTTTIKASRTIGEIQALLAQAGANAVLIQYEAGQPTGIAFRLTTALGEREFSLPCRWRQVHTLLQSEQPRHRTEMHALNVAWRTVQDWLEAQLAIVATEMVSIDEVMLPYMLTAPGRTVYEGFAANRMLVQKED